MHSGILIMSLILTAAVQLSAADEPLLISHRGESRDAPENTMRAFRLAWERNTDGIECDLQLSADHQVIVVHDGNLKRIAGIERNIRDMTAAELEKVDFGRHKGPEFAGEKMLRFEELLAAAPKDKYLFIELKGSDPALVDAVTPIMKKYAPAPDRVRLIAFNAPLLEYAGKCLPQYHRSLLLTLKADTPAERRQLLERGLATARKIGAVGLDLGALPPDDQESVAAVRKAGLELQVWTIDDPEAAQGYRRLGVDVITSNRAAFLREKLNETK